MKHLLAVSACALLLGAILSAPPAQAAPITVDLSGSFGNTYSGPLNGGTFSGTFSVSGLPLTPGSYAYLSSYDVSLYNSHGQLLLTFSSSIAGDYGYVDAREESTDKLDFLEFGSNGGLDVLSLLFAPGFTGVGTIQPSVAGSAGTNLSIVYDDGFGVGNLSVVASGAAALPVPEPSTGALFGAAFAACGAFLTLKRRRRPAALAAA